MILQLIEVGEEGDAIQKGKRRKKRERKERGRLKDQLERERKIKRPLPDNLSDAAVWSDRRECSTIF